MSNVKMKVTPRQKNFISLAIEEIGGMDLSLSDEFYIFVWNGNTITGVHCEEKYNGIRECEEVDADDFIRSIRF